MAKERTKTPLKDYYQDIYGSYDVVNRLFTFGRDRHWRSKAVTECLEEDPLRILDICTGTGDLVIAMAEKAPETEFTGYDFSPEMLKVARAKALERNFKIDFVEGNVADMPFDTSEFDAAGITFGLRNLLFENPAAKKHLSEILRVLKKGGRFVVLESARPSNSIWRFFNGIYLRLILPLLGGVVSGNFKAYSYLGRSSRNYYTRNQMKEILESAGFEVIKSGALFLGSVMLIVAIK